MPATTLDMVAMTADREYIKEKFTPIVVDGQTYVFVSYLLFMLILIA